MGEGLGSSKDRSLLEAALCCWISPGGGGVCCGGTEEFWNNRRKRRTNRNTRARFSSPDEPVMVSYAQPMQTSECNGNAVEYTNGFAKFSR
mmetsp:Transcript_43870/g.44350  ORF Transcript_43870/g.44350 Transcript_43870/m.44350 type:complete len:91 (+) Transcript_43870:332-604(+)